MRPAHRWIPRSRPTGATPDHRLPVLEVVALFLAAHALPAQEAPAFTDPDRAAKVRALGPAAEAMFGDFFRERDVPGLVWGVVLDGELILSGAFGSADLDGGIPADNRSLFRIASMSKSFTALAILQLRDRGLLRLDAPASDYLPEMEGLRLPFDDAPVITVRNLLTHSAGFPEDNPWGDRQLADSDEELLALVEDGISFSNAPGVAYEYSNTGFALLGQIVQRVSGMEFQEYMRRHVFEPLGMDATVWEFEDAPAERLALGYDRADGAWVQVPHEHHGAFGAMGGLITSIEDFAAYAALHLSAWPPRDGLDEGPLRRSSLREMHQPATFSSLQPGYRYPDGRECGIVRFYAFGLSWTRDCDGRVLVAHSGGLPGFGSNWVMMPDYGIAVFAFDNRTYAGTSGVTLAVLDSLVSGAGLEPRALSPSPVLADRMERLVAYLPSWEGAEADTALFADNFFMDERVGDLRDRFTEFFAEAGSITEIGELRPQNRLRGIVTLHGTLRDVEVAFTLSPETEPRIQQVQARLAPEGR